MPTVTTTGSHLAIPQVVKVLSTCMHPDYWHPWRRLWTESGSGSGVLVGPNEILTGAHVVDDATFIQVQRIAEPDKTEVKIKAICHDCDLALLSVTDGQILSGARPVEVGELCTFRDKVTVVGFPIGGEEVSITEGVVSRLEIQRYAHSMRDLLAIQVDAAINPGNSGGPVFRGGKVVGIAFQKYGDAEAMGAMVPAPLIRRFLDGVAQGRSTEIPSLSLWTQGLENSAQRSRFGLDVEDGGIRIAAVEYGGAAWGVLRPDDVLLEIDGRRVGANGTVLYRDRLRTAYNVVYGDHYTGDEIELEVLRAGKRLRLTLQLQPLSGLTASLTQDQLPTYFILGGLVFRPLSLDLIKLFEELHNVPSPIIGALKVGLRTEEQQGLVVLFSILPDTINAGYEEACFSLVRTVNGRAPRDMAHFVELVEGAGAEIDIRTNTHAVIALDPAAVAAAQPAILERYQVPRDRSDDLLPR
jgi:S1-C subfamily serine protease